MKMITAIVNKKDAGSVCDALTKGDDGRVSEGGKHDASHRDG